MPIIKRTVTVAADDVLSGLKFKTQGSPALVSLWASSATAGEDLSFSVGSVEFISAAEINIEILDRVVDLNRDGIMDQEAVPPGEYFLRVPTVAADMTFLLMIEPVPG